MKPYSELQITSSANQLPQRVENCLVMLLDGFASAKVINSLASLANVIWMLIFLGGKWFGVGGR